jgi:hypothetical protein
MSVALPSRGRGVVERKRVSASPCAGAASCHWSDWEQRAKDLFRLGEEETDCLEQALNKAVGGWEDASATRSEEARSLADALPFLARVRPDACLSLLLRACEATAHAPAARAPLADALPRLAERLPSPSGLAAAVAALAAPPEAPGKPAAPSFAANKLAFLHKRLMPWVLRALPDAPSGTFACEWLCRKVWVSLLWPGTEQARRRAARMEARVLDAVFKADALRFFEALRGARARGACLASVRWSPKSARPTCSLRGGTERLRALLQRWADVE